MKCPSCGGELVLGGRVTEAQFVRAGEKFDPKIRYSIYWCDYKKCDNHRKSLVYDEFLKKWK